MKKSYIIAIVAVVLIAAIAFAAPTIMGMFAKMEPAQHLAYAYLETSKVDKASMTMEMTMTVDQEAADALGVFEGSEDPVAMGNYVNSILENVKITYDVTVAQDEKKMPTFMDYELGLDYKDMDLISADFVFEPWVLAMGSEQLYDKMFTVDVEKIMEEALDAEGVNMEDLDLDKYMAIILNDSDDLYKNAMDNTEAYETLIMDYLEANIVELEDDSLTINYNGNSEDLKVTKYQLPIDMETYMLKLQEFLIIFKDDANMQALIKGRVFEVVDTFISSEDYLIFGMELSEVEAMRSELEASYDMQLQMVLDEAINTYGSMDAELAEMGMEISYDLIFSIDKDNMLRGTEVNVLSGFIQMNQVMTYNAFGNDVVIEKVSTENSVDLMALMEDEEQAMELSQEIMGNVFTNIFGGEAFNTLTADLETNADMLPEAEKAQMIESIQGSLQMLPFLLQGGM